MSVFENRIDELVAFQQYYGIFSPSRKDHNPNVASLGRWVHRTRRNHRNGKLRLNHFQALNRVGFEFTQSARRLTMNDELRQSYTQLLTNMLSGKPLPNHQINQYTNIVRADHFGFLMPEHKSLLDQIQHNFPLNLAA